MQKQEFEFQVKQNLSLGNSFGTIKEQDDVELNVRVGINNDSYGWFELYDLESGGEEWYAEGGLWFKDKHLHDYDGVFSLPISVVNKLIELGYNCDYVIN